MDTEAAVLLTSSIDFIKRGGRWRTLRRVRGEGRLRPRLRRDSPSVRGILRNTGVVRRRIRSLISEYAKRVDAVECLSLLSRPVVNGKTSEKITCATCRSHRIRKNTHAHGSVKNSLTTCPFVKRLDHEKSPLTSRQIPIRPRTPLDFQTTGHPAHQRGLRPQFETIEVASLGLRQEGSGRLWVLGNPSGWSCG